MKNFLFLCLLAGGTTAAAMHADKTITRKRVLLLQTDTGIHAEPVIFAPGALPVKTFKNAAPAFSPDGRQVYFHEYFGDSLFVMTSFLANGKWSNPVPASFSGRYLDLEPAFSPNGKFLIFASDRPADDNNATLTGLYNGKSYPNGGGNLWKVIKTKRGWAKPQRLPDYINANTAVFSPNIAANGDLFFMRADSGKKFHIYKSAFRNGAYTGPENQSFRMDAWGDFDPAIAPDESFLIFCSGRPPAPKTTDLFIVFRTANGWSKPYDLRALSPGIHGVEARLSSDCKTLYFSNQNGPDGKIVAGSSYIWQVDISALLKAYGIISIKR